MNIAELRRPERTYTIRNLCQEFKVTPRALRFYEDKGLLNPRRHGLNRVYGHRDRARLIIILRGKRVGLSLAEIREILDLYDRGDGGYAQLSVSLEKWKERLVALQAQRQDIEESIQELERGIASGEAHLAKLKAEGEQEPPRRRAYG